MLRATLLEDLKSLGVVESTPSNDHQFLLVEGMETCYHSACLAVHVSLNELGDFNEWQQFKLIFFCAISGPAVWIRHTDRQN